MSSRAVDGALALSFLLIASAVPAAELVSPEADGLPVALALTPGLQDEGLRDVLDRLRLDGVRVLIAVSGEGLVVADDAGMEEALGDARVRGTILRGPWDESPVRAARPSAEGLARFWNASRSLPSSPRSSIAEPSLTCGTAEMTERLAGATRSGCGYPSPWGLNHFAVGRCAVDLVFPESEGPNSVVDWTAAELAASEAEVLRGLMYWTLRAAGWLTFVVTNHGPVATSVEAATVPPGGHVDLVAETLVSMGFPPSSCPVTDQIYLFRQASIARTGADWLLMQYVYKAYAFYGQPGVAGFAILGGPLSFTHLGTGSRMDFVVAHEAGHVFQALDEYSPLCSCGECCVGYLQAANNNCEECLQTTRCLMGLPVYSATELDEMERYVQPCEWSRKMMGLWDQDADGRWDAAETWPETEMLSAPPETLDTSQTVVLTGHAWDVPYPAPAIFGTPVTVNRIRTVEYRVEGETNWLEAVPLDGLFGDKDESFRLTVPAVGGGDQTLLVRGVNTTGLADPAPERIPFFVYDVLLDGTPSTWSENGDLYLIWQIDGDDFGSTYSVYRRAASGTDEIRIADVPSQGGRDRRFSFHDPDVVPGREYVYRLEVDIPGKGRKTLGLARGEAVLAAPRPGSQIVVGPNPTPGAVLVTVTVPRGPREGVDDVLLPGLGPDDNGGGSSSSLPLAWRDARLAIYDVRGRLVRDLGTFRGQETTRFNVAWDGRGPEGLPAPTGLYFLRADFSYARFIEKVVVRRP